MNPLLVALFLSWALESQSPGAVVTEPSTSDPFECQWYGLAKHACEIYESTWRLAELTGAAYRHKLTETQKRKLWPYTHLAYDPKRHSSPGARAVDLVSRLTLPRKETIADEPQCYLQPGGRSELCIGDRLSTTHTNKLSCNNDQRACEKYDKPGSVFKWRCVCVLS